MTGTGGSPEGMNGGAPGRAPWLDRRDCIALVTVIAASLMVAVVNAFSVADDMAGAALDPWEPWVWELSSAAFWIIIGLPLIRLLRRLRPPQLRLPAAIAAVALISIPVCAVHMGFLAVSRAAAYAALGGEYSYGWSRAHIIYEWRKDLLSVTIFAILAFVMDRLAAEPVAPSPAGSSAIPPFRLEVRDGARTRWFAAADIERIEAAGNYVELHTSAGAVLHRATLAAVTAQLMPHGFARIHRSRLVRCDAITALATTASGDFEATLASGAIVAGSRRFRAGVAIGSMADIDKKHQKG